MNDHPSSPEKPSIIEAVSRIKAAILSIEPSRIEDFLRKKFNLGLNAFTIGVRADDEIDILAKQACLGDEEAVSQLVRIGNRVSAILDYLTNLKQNKESNSHESPYQEHPSKFDLPTDLRTLATVSIRSLNESLGLLRERGAIDRFDITLDELMNLLNQSPADSKKEFHGGKKNQQSQPEQPENWDAVEAICMALVNQRMQERARIAAIELAAHSRHWPISIPAIADNRVEDFKQRMERLKLGSALEVVVDPGTGRGKKRDTLPGAPMPFAMKIFKFLEHEKNILRAVQHLEEMEKPEYLEEFKSRHDKNTDPSKSEFPGFYWMTKAALLPEFRSDRRSLVKWHEAAMEYAKWWCQDDFNKFSDIRCVRSRNERNTKAGEVRNPRASVSIILEEQFEKLAKNP